MYVALHPRHFRKRDDAAGAVAHARRLHQQIYRTRYLLADGGKLHVRVGQRYHHLQARNRVARCVGVNGRQGAARRRCSWPGNMSNASSPRTSPTTIRSGRICGRLLTSSSRWPATAAPWPSMLGGRVSRRTTCGCLSCNSAASSMVTIRSLPLMNAESAR